MRLLEMAHLHLAPVLRAGACVIDATAGGGHDSLFLAQALGAQGQVHAYDVQEAALQKTRARLQKAGLADCLHTHLCSHAEMAQHHAPASVAAIMFNLGYLPGADHGLTTQTPSTLAALEAALTLLQPLGRMCITCYPGHEGGDDEAAAVGAFLCSIPLKRARVAHSLCHNGAATAPQLYTLELLS